MTTQKKTLDSFIANNPKSNYKIRSKTILVFNPWGDETLKLVIPKTENLSLLNNIILPEELIAIYHTKEELLEFIYSPSDPTESVIKRNFIYNFEGKSYKCYFDISSNVLELLAKSYQPQKPAEKSNHRNLNEFSDYYNQAKLPKFLKDYFKGTKPYSFYISGKLGSLKGKYTPLLKSLNFYLSFYDRESPSIVILSKEKEKNVYNNACYSNKEDFPEIINVRNIDPTITEILNIANRTEDTRLQFMFYFQVLEYCSYYFLENNIKNTVSKILKKPDINYNSTAYTKTIIEELHDHILKNKDDSRKMEKTLTHYCTIDDIKFELECNIDFFCQDLEFEGGLKIPKLFNDKTALNSLTENNLLTIRSNIEKIRNVLAHLRESRENKVVLPTENNNSLLVPYLTITRRLAEKIAIQYE